MRQGLTEYAEISSYRNQNIAIREIVIITAYLHHLLGDIHPNPISTTLYENQFISTEYEIL